MYHKEDRKFEVAYSISKRIQNIQMYPHFTDVLQNVLKKIIYNKSRGPTETSLQMQNFFWGIARLIFAGLRGCVLCQPSSYKGPKMQDYSIYAIAVPKCDYYAILQKILR
jgi:hypothetical protein